MFPPGYRTASVIIALTDGELRENQFDLAEREVETREHTNTCTQHTPLFMFPQCRDHRRSDNKPLKVDDQTTTFTQVYSVDNIIHYQSYIIIV